MLVSDKLQCKPFAIGRPGIIKASSGAIPCGTVCHLAYFFCIEIHHHQAVTVFDKGKFLAVRWKPGIGALHLGGRQQYFLFDKSGIREVGFFLACYFSQIQFPITVSLAGVCQCAVIGCKGYPCFACRGVGNLFGSSVISRSDKDFSAYDECNLFSIGWHRGRSSALGKT